jgi:geranylgeranyl reductase
MCDDPDVQRLTFDSYLNKRIVPVPWLVQLGITKHWLETALREWQQLRRKQVVHSPA